MEEERKEFKAVCAECGKECQIPFEPKEGRPVKCRDCFKKGRPQRNFTGSRGGNWRKEFDVTCADCGKETTVPFKPTQGKPVLCRDCYSKK